MTGNQSGSDSFTSDQYRQASNEVKSFLENVLESHEQLNHRAIDLVKIDILALSVIVTALTWFDFRIDFLVVGGSVAFMYSAWAASYVYRPRNFKRGIGRDGGVQIDKAIKNSPSNTEFYRRILYSYIDAAEESREAYEKEKEKFDMALWASIVAILFFIFSFAFMELSGLDIWFETPLLIILPLIGLWGKEKEA